MNNKFICDVCGNAIASPREGMLQWICFDNKEGDKKIRGIRIVHAFTATKGKCLYDEKAEFSKDRGIVGDDHLDNLTSIDGLTYLLQMIYDKESPAEDVIRIIQRIFIDDHEAARHHAATAIAKGLLDENLAPGFYHSKTLKLALDLHRQGLV